MELLYMETNPMSLSVYATLNARNQMNPSKFTKIFQDLPM